MDIEDLSDEQLQNCFEKNKRRLHFQSLFIDEIMKRAIFPKENKITEFKEQKTKILNQTEINQYGTDRENNFIEKIKIERGYFVKDTDSGEIYISFDDKDKY
jgi:hypothetical protein